MSVLVKTCGLSTRPTLDAALAGGADMVGFVFFERSPRHVSLDRATALVDHVAHRAHVVVLTVDADDDTLAAIVDAFRPDLLQLHGTESPARVREIQTRFHRPVIKALGVQAAADLARADAYAEVAEHLLFDAKPPTDATRPGGNGTAFDWRILRGLRTRRPWLLAGGLTPENVADALAETGAPALDVSSGIEVAPGVKDVGRIAAFLRAAKGDEDPWVGSADARA